jgi:hypothetical protein
VRLRNKAASCGVTLQWKSQKLSGQKLFNLISRAIVEATETTLLAYKNVDPVAGPLAVDSLNEDGRVEQISTR